MTTEERIQKKIQDHRDRESQQNLASMFNNDSGKISILVEWLIAVPTTVVFFALLARG